MSAPRSEFDKLVALRVRQLAVVAAFVVAVVVMIVAGCMA